MSKTNCPNCGAVITGAMCEYCGTVFNLETVENEKPVSFGVSASEAAEAFLRLSKMLGG